MRKIKMFALLLALVLLAACAQPITAEEAQAIALEKIRADAADEYTQLYEDRITCTCEEREGTAYYVVEVPFMCACCGTYVRTFTLRIYAETGEIARFMMSK